MKPDTLWAPWRIRYIRGTNKRKKCIFCGNVKAKENDFAVFKTKYSVCLLNIFPYNNGHLMIAPVRHVKDISWLKETEALDLFKSLTKARKLLDKTLNPHGYNIGINTSRVAGAGIAGHLHIHIVPRWQGDTNFMPVIYNTKVISQSLEELYRQLKHVQSKTD